MKDLKSFSIYLRNNRLKALLNENIRQIAAADIPSMKYHSNLSAEQFAEMSVKGTDSFLLSFENGNAIAKTGIDLGLTGAGILSGLRKKDIHPCDLIRICCAQKKAFYKFIAMHADTVSEATGIAAELEDFYSKVQTEGMQWLFEIPKKTDQELEQFAYMASHDLQEPLRIIKSYVQLLAERYKDKLDEDANNFINRAIQGTERMQGFINGLLEYSRVNRSEKFELVDINVLMNEVIKDLAHTIQEENTIVKCEEMPVIYADRMLMSQLFLNLITNSIRFSSNKTPEIIISAKTTDNDFQFTVKDNGIGIQKEFLEKIFVIFQRLHAKDKYPGTGIGLAICKKIVERHDGKIWAESEPGKGSDFHFTVKRNIQTTASSAGGE